MQNFEIQSDGTIACKSGYSFKHDIDIECSEQVSLSQNKQTEIFTQKGKYFYLPIKMSFIGYPLSGKKVQSNLISLKYPISTVLTRESII